MKMQIVARAALFFAVAAFGGRAVADSAVGEVTGVADGDTFYMQIEGRSTRVRLSEVDAPEKKQPFGRRSEQSLRELVAKKSVAATWSKVDRYGRPIVRVVVDGVDVNAEQVKRGFAWVYRKYSTDSSLYVFENEARLARRGLWVDPSPVEPWEWRRARR